MKKFLIVLLVATCHIKSALAVNTIFVPVQQNTGISSQITSHTQYGLTDKEIERRIELGLIHTIPISALLKWQESKKNQAIQKSTEHNSASSQTQTLITENTIIQKTAKSVPADAESTIPAPVIQPMQNTQPPPTPINLPVIDFGIITPKQ